MFTQQQQRAREIYFALLDLDTPHERADFIERECHGHAGLQSAVVDLLEAHEANGSFLEQPLDGVLADRANGEPAATMAMPTATEQPGSKIGPYKLLQQIGEGGFGVVYMAEQTQPVRRKVALKLIKPGMDTREVIARFEAERQALALMDHPNIAKVLDAGTTGKVEGRESRVESQKALDPGPSALDPPGRPYFVMELVHGVPMTEFCDDNRLTTRERLELFVAVCRAVQHAHQKGIIHRDLKPSNVMVTMRDDRPAPKVIDFGISKALSQQLTEKTLFTAYGQMIGTPLYMSPEQAQLNEIDVDTRSDVYSLGVLLYELLTGSTPFDKETLHKSGFEEMRRMIREVDPPRPSARISTLNAELLSTVSGKRRIDSRKLSPSYRGELDWIVMKALEKDRNRRYETASTFAADVERYLADEPVQACPPSVGYRLRKVARRNKTLLWTVSAVMTAMLIGTAVSLWHAILADQARQQADDEKVKAVAAQKLADSRSVQSRTDFDRALKSFDTIVEEVSSAEFAQMPGVARVRKEILDKALKFYQAIIADHDNDPYARMQYAVAYGRIAYILNMTGRPDEAQETLNTSIRILEKLIQEYPDRYQYESALADRLFNRMHLLSRSRKDQLADAERALEIKRRHLDQRHLVNGIKKDANLVALHYFKVAERLPANAPRARKLIDESIRITAAHDLPPVPPANIWLAQRAKQSGKLEAAVRFYRRGIQSYEAWAADPHRRDNHIERWLASVETANLAKVYEKLGKPKQAETAYRVALQNAGRLYRGYHEIPGYRRSLRDRIRDLTRFLSAQSRNDDALMVEEEFARELTPRTAEEYVQRAQHYQESKQHAKALGDYEKAVGMKPHDSEIQNQHAELIRGHNSPAKAVPELSRLISKYPGSSAYYRYRGAVLCDQGEYERALEDLNTAIARLADDGDLRTYQSRAMLFVRMKQYDKAVADYDEYVKRSSNSATAHFERGSFYLYTLKDYKNALADFDRSLQIDPKPWHRYKRRALAHFYLRHYDKALADVAKAIELNPEDGSNLTWIPPELVAKCPDRAFRDGMLKLADETVDKKDGPSVRWGRASLLRAFGQDKQALADLNKAVALDPKNAAAHYNLGSALGRQGKLNEAIAVYRKAIALDPKFAYAHNNLGYALDKQGKLDEAIVHYRMAIALDPKLAVAHNNLASALGEQGKLDEAIVHSRKAVALAPNNAVAHTNLGKALRKQGKLNEAIALYRKAIALDPKNAGVHKNLGTALRAQGKLNEAITEYRKAIALDPKDAVAHNNLAVLLGDLDEAIALYRKAIALDPKLAVAHYSLGDALRKQGKLNEAIAHCRRAIALDPKAAHAHNNLGYALREQGKLNEAIVHYRKAIALDPKHPIIHINLAVALGEQGQPDEAIASYRNAIAIFRRKGPNGQTSLSGVLALLATTLLKQKEFQEAQAAARESLEIRKKTMPESWLCYNAEHILGAALLGTGELEKAEPLLLSGYHGMQQREATIPALGKHHLAAAARRLVELYERKDDPARAGVWRRKLPRKVRPPVRAARPPVAAARP